VRLLQLERYTHYPVQFNSAILELATVCSLKQECFQGMLVYSLLSKLSSYRLLVIWLLRISVLDFQVMQQLQQIKENHLTRYKWLRPVSSHRVIIYLHFV